VKRVGVDLPKEEIDKLFADVREALETLEASLPRSVDGFALSDKTKVPFKVLWFREAAFWRMTQLSRSAFDCFEQRKLASAILLVRASMETCAAIWYLRQALERSIETQTISDADQRVVQLLMGSRVDPNLREAVNVLKCVDSVEKTIPGFRHQYDWLSEFAHPNWAGTVLLFSKREDGGIANFGENMRQEESVLSSGLHNLAGALDVFRVAYERVGALMPDFIPLSEANLQAEADDAG
jgi:hypothetical protein